MKRNGQLIVSVLLGITQTIGYGSLYYAFGVLAPLMADDTGYSLTAVYGIFSVGLVASGLVAPLAGRSLDRFGPARVMAMGSMVAALLLAAWALVPGKTAFALFAVAVEMVSVLVLYEAAFVAAARLEPDRARRTITGITLIAGFASTIFWPLTTWLSSFLTWREVYLAYAGLNLLVCAPIHLALSRRFSGGARLAAGGEDSPSVTNPHMLRGPRDRRFAYLLLLVAFSANAYVISAVHLHLIGLLGALGLAASAALVGAVIGPSQVAGRVMEFAAGDRISVLTVAMLSAIALPLALAILMIWPGMVLAGLAFAVIFGLGQGLSYIVRGVLPLSLFGTDGYGALMGRINSARLFVSAGAPFVTAALFERAGVQVALGVILVAGLIGVAGLVAVVPLARKNRQSDG